MIHNIPTENKKLDLVLLLTGTISVNAIFTKHNNSYERRSEYLKSLKFYSNFSKIFFLENSGYDFSLDKDFLEIDNVIYYQHPKSKAYTKGKGYQEFEMIDGWLKKNSNKSHAFIKISGRYLIENIDKIIKICKEDKQSTIIIERNIFAKKIALTDIFYVTTDYYLNNISGLYRKCNDKKGIYIEHVIRDIVDKNKEAKVFRNYPLKLGKCGSTGLDRGNFYVLRIKSLIKDFLYFVNSKYRIF
jgi:hypothetical protein